MLSDKPLCEFAQRNNYGVLICCGTDDVTESQSPAFAKTNNCSFQRYCALEQIWHHTDHYAGCKRKESLMSKKKNRNNAEIPVIKVEDIKTDIPTENADLVIDSLVSELKILEDESEKKELNIEETKKEPIYGEVSTVTPYYITIMVNGNGIRKNGSYNVKPKDIVDITTL